MATSSLAPRAGENSSLFDQLDAGTASFGHRELDSVFRGTFNEKDRSYSWPKGESISTPRGRTPLEPGLRNPKSGAREVRHVPFEKESFQDICNAFFVHPSISKAISRADAPLFSRIDMTISPDGSDSETQAAIGLCALAQYVPTFFSLTPFLVYNCRSANTWKNDVALTVTYLPQRNLTFAILFGCNASIEKEVLNRLASAKERGFHPLLLPGIFVELERDRMAEVVEVNINKIEETIYELDTGDTHYESTETGHPAGPRYMRRTVWLNVTFLRNRLRILKTQFLKLIEHAEELLVTSTADHELLLMNHTGRLIRDRLRIIVEDLDEMIDDCSMRVDGMTIATQWVRIFFFFPNLVGILKEGGKGLQLILSIEIVSRRYYRGDCRGCWARFQPDAIHLTRHHDLFTRDISRGEFTNTYQNWQKQ